MTEPLVRSIHPRVWLGGAKRNTCAPRSLKRFERAMVGAARHLDSNPSDYAARKRFETLKRRASGE